MTYVTFEDIQAACEKDLPLKSMDGKKVRIRCADPVDIMQKLEVAQKLEKDADVESTAAFFKTVREIVGDNMIVPKIAPDAKIPTPVLMEIFNGIASFSGAGPETQEEAANFRDESGRADGGAAHE